MVDAKVHNEEVEQSINAENQQTVKEDEGKKEQNCCLFVFCVISTIGISFQNLPMFLSSQPQMTIGLIIAIIVLSFFSFLITSCKTSYSKCQSFHLFILLDDIFVALMAAIVGFIGVLTLSLPQGEIYIYVVVVFMNLELVLMAGAWRVLLAVCLWKTWQVVIGKLGLLISCGMYLILAAQIILNGFTIDLGKNEERMKQFFFLYVFGLFTLYIEIYTKITELDGTGNFKYEYKILNSEEKEKQKSVVKERNYQTNITLENNRIFQPSLVQGTNN